MSLPADFIFSQSSLQDYNDCPRRFRLRFIERLAWPAIESEPALENERRLRAGQEFHRLAHQHLIGLPAETLAAQADTPDLHRWWDSFTNAPDLQKLRSMDLHPEATLSAPIGGFRLTAKYDLVAISQDGMARIYDWKTYAHRPRSETLASRWQTRVYRALLVEAGTQWNDGHPLDPEKVEMIYWLPEFPGEPVRLAYSSTQHQRDLNALEQTIGEIAVATDFPMTDDHGKCAYCPYRSYCGRGIAAGQGSGDERDVEAASLDLDFEQIAEIEF